MNTESSTSERKVTVSTTVRAAPRTVFGILTDEDRFSEWIQGTAKFDPQPGSDFSIDFPQFQTVIRGKVVDVVQDQRVVFTWGVAEGEQHPWFPPGSSTLSIELEKFDDGRTRVMLVHDDLPGREVTPHHHGWRFHLDRMDLWSNRVQLLDHLGPRLEAWRTAWCEPDDDTRASLLERCCDESFHYADEYVELEGRDRLSLHIGNTLRMMPFARFETGPPRVNRGSALVGWRVVGDDEEEIQRGDVVVQTDDQGRFLRATSFQS